MSHDLQNAVVVITGASSGIGRATAHEFARQGAALFLAARDRRALHDVAEECHRQGGQARVVVTDVTRTEDVERLARTAVDTAGRIDVWVNNAGIGALGNFDEIPIEAHEQVIQTDLLGYVRGAHAVLPHFKRQQSGVLINNISLGGWAAQPYAASYAAAKFGLRGFAESLLGELHAWPRIHVCNLYPAVMDSPGFRDGGNFTGRAVKPVPPVYDPRRTARAIVRAAQHPRPSIYVGSVSRLARFAQAWLPGYSIANARLVETALGRAAPDATSSGNLFSPPTGERRIDGGFRQPSSHRSSSTALIATTAAVAALGLYWYRRQRR